MSYLTVIRSHDRKVAINYYYYYYHYLTNNIDLDCFRICQIEI